MSHERDGSALDVVLLSWGQFGSDWNIPEVLSAAVLEVGGRVLYVEKPRAKGGSSKLEQVGRSFWVLRNPIRFPNRFWRVPAFNRLRGLLLAPRIRAVASQLGFEDPLLLLSSSSLGPIEVMPRFSDWRRAGVAADWWIKPRIRALEIEMASESDFLLTISDCVYDRYRQLWPTKAVRIPYACDYEAYLDPRITEAPVIRHIARPRLGYLGAAGGRIKRDLLVGLASRNPTWNFVIVGNHPPARKDDSADVQMRALRNVYLIGPQERSALPGIVKSFDVGLLPYPLDDEQVFHCTPQKVWEYFASGIPVVSTPILELQKFGRLIRFGISVDEFEQGIRASLAEPDDSPLRLERRLQAKAVGLAPIGKELLRLNDLQRRKSK